MAQLTGNARYSDLFEWQLYNAAAVGMGLEGDTYFYNNPLACRGGVSRKAWYAVPCCPSNISRTWADLGKYIYTIEPGAVTIHQYISNQSSLNLATETGQKFEMKLELESRLPWDGKVVLRISESLPQESNQPLEFALRLRQPSWAERMHISINGGSVIETFLESRNGQPETSAGFDPRRSEFRTLKRVWKQGDEISIHFEMLIQLRRAHPRVKGYAGKVAVSRGPLVYCLEDVDNPEVDMFNAHVAPGSLSTVDDPAGLGGVVKVIGKSTKGESLTFIPYFLWGNRGPSKMTVWVNV
jgi:DUF1680 family protein